METKVCRICGIEKKLEQFRKNGKYYRSECKECENERCKQYQLKNKEQIKQKQKEYRELHKEQISKYKKEHYNKEEKRIYNAKYRKAHKEYYSNWHKEYSQKHKEELLEYNRNFRKANPEKVKKYQQNDYQKRARNPILRLKRNLRNRIKDSFRKKRYNKSKQLEQILGCNIDEFTTHLLKTYKDNYNSEWDGIEPVHIDHIKPLALAQNEEEVIKLCHHSNLQLLKAKDNLRKNKFENWEIS